MLQAVHITHEPVRKIGGIGTVLEGILTARSYRDAVQRTLLVGPLFDADGDPAERLGPGGKVLYSSLDGVLEHKQSSGLQAIEMRHGVRVVYGHRLLKSPETDQEVPIETVLIDVSHSNTDRVCAFKRLLWDRFLLDSMRYEWLPEYENYVRMAEPAYEVARLLLGSHNTSVFISHDFMGLPTALKIMRHGPATFRTVLYAHEVAPARLVAEELTGNDTAFYNVLRAAESEGRTLEGVFGPQDDYFKYPLFLLARHCDGILAVSDRVREELRFLRQEFRHKGIDCVYNGVPAEQISWEERQKSRERLQDYACALVGFRPDYVFAHVARPVVSKAFWRDFQVLRELDSLLYRAGQSAVLFILGSEGSYRRSRRDVHLMERSYGWPLFHRYGMPDLMGYEATVNDLTQTRNLVARSTRAVYINQFVWSRETCGSRMPSDVGIEDLWKGTDAAFGLSLYEPFGISPLEPLTYGSISVISSSCGALGAIEKANGQSSPNVLVGDYITVHGWGRHTEDYLRIDDVAREAIEEREGHRLAEELFRRLSTDTEVLKERLDSGCALASRMSWESVARDQLVPALRRVGGLSPASQPR